MYSKANASMLPLSGGTDQSVRRKRGKTKKRGAARGKRRSRHYSLSLTGENERTD